MGKQRAIRSAIDQITRKILIADDLFKESKKGAEARKLYNENLLLPMCLECEQKLQISKSVNERHYFKHFQDSLPCFLKDNKFSEKESELIEAILVAKESQRHKYLKNKISRLLVEAKGVDIESVYTDNRFIYHGKEKRRPDVYCLYEGKELVFEIQLSDLSLRYILDRHNFYKRKGIYLIWILDKFDVRGQSKMEKDIKYLSSFQNFFRLDEGADLFKLHCTYKEPMVTDGRVITPWKNKSVSLPELKFCGESFQAYYYDFEGNRKRREEEIAKILSKPLKVEYVEEYDDFEERWLEERSQEKVEEFIQEMSLCRKNGLPTLKAEKLLADFDSDDFALLHDTLEFDVRRPGGKPLLSRYIEKATKDQFSFVHFVLQERRIEIDVNSKDDAGGSVFMEVYRNKELGAKELLIIELFKRGYQLTSHDLSFCQSEEVNIEDKTAALCIFPLYQRAGEPDLINAIYQNKSLFYVIESARQQKITGFRYANWISFGINAIHLYKKHWSYIEPAFKEFGVWELILKEDRKGTFNNKLIYYRDELPDQDTTVLGAIKSLYPTLFKR